MFDWENAIALHAMHGLKETLNDKNKFCLLHNLTHGALPDWGLCKRVRQIFLHIPEIPLGVLPTVSHQ